MRLLIAEDEVDLAEALTVFFEKNHFSVDAVHNGFDAYEYASSGAYDAVILDVMMPKMDGIQVLEKLRQEDVKTPIMMLTAKGQKSDRTTAPSTPSRTTGRSPSPPSSNKRFLGKKRFAELLRSVFLIKGFSPRP